MPLLVHAFVSLEHLDVHVTLVSQATMQTLLDFAKVTLFWCMWVCRQNYGLKQIDFGS